MKQTEPNQKASKSQVVVLFFIHDYTKGQTYIYTYLTPVSCKFLIWFLNLLKIPEAEKRITYNKFPLLLHQFMTFIQPVPIRLIDNNS